MIGLKTLLTGFAATTVFLTQPTAKKTETQSRPVRENRVSLPDENQLYLDTALYLPPPVQADTTHPWYWPRPANKMPRFLVIAG